LVDYWNLDAKYFMLEEQSLAPTKEDIYFLIGLSRRGESVNLNTFPPRPYVNVQYIGKYCEARTNLYVDMYICGTSETSGFPSVYTSSTRADPDRRSCCRGRTIDGRG
jgi:hypothetical protein